MKRSALCILAVLSLPLHDLHRDQHMGDDGQDVRGTHPAVSDQLVRHVRAAKRGAPGAQRAVRGRTITQIILNVEPIGSIDLPTANLVSFRLAKTFRLRKSQSMEARFDFYNVLNTNFVTARTTRAGSAYLVPTAIIEPRILQMGFTDNF